jgi:hypothetical protein
MRPLAICSLALLAAASLALAADPKNGTYQGLTEQGEGINLTVQGSRFDTGDIFLFCPPNNSISFLNVKIRDTGKFRKVLNTQEGAFIARLKGKFVTRKKAQGTLSTDECSGAEPTISRAFTVTRVPPP